MRKRVAVCLLVVFAAVFGSAACAGVEEQQDVEILEQRMQALEQEVAQLRQLVEGGQPQPPQPQEPQQEQTQPQKTQQEKTQ